MWPRTKTSAWLSIFGLVLLAAGLFWLRLPAVSWQSSLLDTLPRDADPAHHIYMTRQQSNEQRFMLLFEIDKEDFAAFTAALRKQLTQLANGEPRIQPIEELNPQAFLAIYQDYAGYWATPEDLQLLQEQPSQLIAQAQQRLQQPLPLWADIRQDPLLLSQRLVEALPEPLPSFQAEKPFYVRHHANQSTIALALTSTADTLSQAQSREVVARTEQMLSSLTATDIPHTVSRSGLVFHADAAASQAKQEITWFGGLSLVFVLLLLWWVFRSLLHLLFSAVILGVSTLVGVTAVMWCFSSPHVLTLVFATTLIGLCIDYVFHASIGASHGRHNWQQVVPALLLGAATTIAGFFLLTFLALPLLQQLGVFMAAALASVVGMVLLIPVLGLTKRTAPHWQSLHQAIANTYQKFSPTLRSSLLAIVAFVAVFAAWQGYRSDDSVRLLATSSEPLLAQEQHIRAQTQAYYDAEVILVQAPTLAELYQRYATAHRQLKKWQQQGWLADWQSWYDYVPTAQQQHQTASALAELWQQPLGQNYLTWLGIPAPSLAKSKTVVPSTHPLYPDFFYAPTAPDEPAVGVIRLRKVAQSAAISQDLKELAGVELFSPLTQASNALSHYRGQLMQWMLGLLLLLVIVLTWRLPYPHWQQRFRTSLQISAVIVAALSSALAIAAIWQPLNAFHFVGAILVIVLGIDYGVFCASRIHRAHALQAISISALTTMFAFGALSFSQTAAIAAFGLTVLVGVAITALLVPLLTPANSLDSV